MHKRLVIGYHIEFDDCGDRAYITLNTANPLDFPFEVMKCHNDYFGYICGRFTTIEAADKFLCELGFERD